MASPHFFNTLLVMAHLALLHGYVIAQISNPFGIHGIERNALWALRDNFNNSFLNDNWTSINVCLVNDPSNWYGIECTNGRVSGVVLENMGLTGIINPDALFNLSELSVLSFQNNSISGNIMNFSYNLKLRLNDLSENYFDGPISDSLLNLNLLESLQLQNNKLTGSIPGFNQSSLREFNVSNNRLSGKIPNTPLLQSYNSSSFLGNPGLCGPPSSTSCNDTSNMTDPGSDKSGGGGSKDSFLSPGLLIFNVVGFIVIVFLFIIYLKKSRKLKEEVEKRSKLTGGAEKADRSSIELSEKSSSVMVQAQEKGKLIFIDDKVGFELDGLLKASAEGLGKGNFGNCYRTVMSDGLVVVVKRLRDLKPLSNEEFERQLTAIGHLKHPNLLPLLAYYYSKDEKLVVFKFASKGNLYNRLHGARGTKDRIPFQWSSRLVVARAVARAMEYLHRNLTSNALPHGNLKSTNVLLDGTDSVLISDYSLTSIISPAIASHRMVAFKSPEFRTSKRVSPKSDVWTFGCLLLELLTGRVSAHGAPHGVTGGVDLGSWVHRAVREEWTAEIFDPEIAAKGSAAAGMLRLLQIAVRCCDKSPENRPEMEEVVREVEVIKVVVESEDEDSVERSFATDDSVVSATPATIIRGDD